MKRAITVSVLAWLASAALGAALADAPKEHVVRVVTNLDTFHMRFEPKHLTVAPGDTVIWVNEADVDHNIMTYPDGYPKGGEALDSPFLSVRGDRWSHTFRQEGTYEYHCVPHLLMGMRGTVVVGRPSAPHEFHEPDRRQVERYRALLLEYFDGEEAEFKPRGERAALTP